MDLGRAIGYPLKDQNWFVKLLIGAVISLIPIVNFIAYGYMLRVIREVMAGEEDTMPEWDDFAGDFVRGFLSLVGVVVYYLPVIVLYCCFAVATSVASSSSSSTSQNDGSPLFGLLFCCVFGLILLYILVISPMLAAAYARYATTDDFASSFLNFSARLAEVRSHMGETVMLIVLYLVVQIIMGLLVSITIWLCGLGLLFAWASYVISAHLIAQYGLAIDSKRKNDIVFA